MARPPAISMHRTSGRAAPGPALSPRPPGGAHCARAAPRGGPEPARSPQRARRPVSASWGPRLPPAREARELGESRGARRPGPPRQGVGAPGPARFRFRRGQRSPEALVADAETGCCPPLLGEVRWLRTGKPGSEEEERRGAGPGGWGLAVRLARPSLRPGAVPPCEELREMAPCCALRFTRAKEGSVSDQDSDPWPRACAVRARERSAGRVPARSSAKGRAVDLRVTGHYQVPGRLLRMPLDPGLGIRPVLTSSPGNTAPGWVLPQEWAR
ncbi:translation initiation factor IF-2-like [Lontra canadensis]|uniref:translation initiation factor IF-2-like n=1 Tax=Lontra canadensis TaxID=76717 RepID=UPI0013F2DD0D|nr:translation initiation factor IF-2-like [Lontra canadensis]